MTIQGAAPGGSGPALAPESPWAPHAVGDQAPEALVGATVHGRYRVDAVVATGGMSTVYRAWDTHLQRTVALKVMQSGLAADPAFVARFEREARAAARFTHPTVVAMYDQGAADGLVYLVMEYVPGRTARTLLRSGPLDPVQALRLMDPVAQALAAAHTARIVHRDVKPENVLVSDDGRVKVTDFGLARAIEASEPSARTSGILLGTVAYLAPEQFTSGHADARSDVYAAGIMLYELTVGAVPYSGDTAMAVAYQHVHNDVPRPSSMRAGLPQAIDSLVKWSTQRDPERRYQSGTDLLTKLRAARELLGDEGATSGWTPPVVAPESGQAGAASATTVLPAGTLSAAAGVGVAAHAGGTDSSSAAPTTLDSPVLVSGAVGPTTSPDQAPPAPPTTAEPANQAGGGANPPTPASDAGGKRRRRGPLMVLVLAALVGLLGFGGWYIGTADYVQVPRLTGLTPAQAEKALDGTTLRLVTGTPEFSETVAKGKIINSDPRTGQRARKGDQVVVVVSKGKERYKVPNVIRMTPEEAATRLQNANLKLGVTEQAYSDTVPAGLVMKVKPRKGELVKRGTPVSLVVSQGPAPVQVPDLTGQDAFTAAARLGDLGLKSQTIEEESDTVASGVVIRLEPSSGSTVLRGDTVTMVISTGPALLSVPGVTGMDADEARRQLEGAGFTVRFEEPAGVSPLNRVTGQDPPAGTQVPKGTLITLRLI